MERERKLARDKWGHNTFSALAYPSLSRRIAEQLHAAILAGDIKHGQKITEQEICAATGASRTSVREAFQELRALGVLTMERHRTCIISEPSAEEIQDIYAFRGLCEGLAAESAKDHLLPIHFERLESLVDEMDWAGRRRDFETFRKADLAFHSIIWQANEKTYLRRMLDIVTIPHHSFFLALLRRGSTRQLRQMARIHRDHLQDLKRPGKRHLKRRLQRHYARVCAMFLKLYKGRRRS